MKEHQPQVTTVDAGDGEPGFITLVCLLLYLLHRKYWEKSEAQPVIQILQLLSNILKNGKP